MDFFTSGFFHPPELALADMKRVPDLHLNSCLELLGLADGRIDGSACHPRRFAFVFLALDQVRHSTQGGVHGAVLPEHHALFPRPTGQHGAINVAHSPWNHPLHPIPEPALADVYGSQVSPRYLLFRRHESIPWHAYSCRTTVGVMCVFLGQNSKLHPASAVRPISRKYSRPGTSRFPGRPCWRDRTRWQAPHRL